MNVQRRDFLLLVTLAAGVATPTWGQVVAPSIAPAGSGTQSAASIPDFSGIWAHPSGGFEPPLSGPGPVRNKSRRPTGESNFDQLVGDYTNPILQQPERITFLYVEDHEVRHVRMNQPHPARVTPSWYGDSVGHYEGDTLVIDTVGIKVGPFAMVDMYGTPF